MEALALLVAQFIISFESVSPQPKKRKIEINNEHFDSKCTEFKLTKREKEILLSTIKGFTNREICAHFDITWNTLRTHLKNIHNKAGANDRDKLIDLFANVKLNAEAENTASLQGLYKYSF
jgi:DNA-binding CsgD family transcriptional regulator